MSIAEQTAIRNAEVQVDAERGAELIKALELKWFEQGYNSFLCGMSRSDQETNWSRFHRRGWDWARSLVDAQMSEHGTLDAMPLPMWDEMLAQVTI